MKRKADFRILGGISALVLFFACVFAGTFFLTSALYPSLDRQLSPFLAQTITSLLGLFIGGAILTAISTIFSNLHAVKRARHGGVFGPIIEAMERIAKGDFDVRLNDDIRENAMLGDLAKSVNNMALELGRLEQMRREFVSNVSHEIQSPLTSIRGFAEALQDDELRLADRHHYLTIIETESIRLSRLTENLLRLASLESEQVSFEPKPFRLDKQIRNLVLACEPQWSAKEIELEVALEEVTIDADEDLLSQVWINLLHNGIKFTPPGGSICVELRQGGPEAVFRIVDTGSGIPEEDQPRIFERFYKADKSRERSKEGSGLGLAIAKKIVELHRGTIQLESKIGTGSTFTVALPVRR